MVLEWSSYEPTKALGGNPTANIPGLRDVINALRWGFVQTSQIRVVSAGSGVLNYNELFVVFTGSEESIFTIPQTANAPGKILFVKNNGSAAFVVKDDAQTPNTIVSLTAGRSAILFSNGSSWYSIVIDAIS